MMGPCDEAGAHCAHCAAQGGGGLSPSASAKPSRSTAATVSATEDHNGSFKIKSERTRPVTGRSLRR